MLRLLRPLFAFAFLLGGLAAGSAQAGVMMHPPGLNPGDVYQLAFGTSTGISQASPLLSTYELHVQNAAAAGSATMGIPTTWHAVVSTLDGGIANVNAPSMHPVYNVDASWSLLTEDFYGPDLLVNALVDESGTTVLTEVWTGSLPAGTGSGFPLGTPDVTVGFPFGSLGALIKPAFLAFSTRPEEDDLLLPIIGLSEPITVPTPPTDGAVPEPASLAVWSCLAGLGLLGANRKRKRRDPKSQPQV